MKEYTVAITGNPNTGKTSIFNSLAHQNQKVGNWPGVTVEKKDGILFQDNTKRIKIIDLPGIYSLRSASEDEIIASDFIIKNNPSMTVVVLDASRLERSLYLFMQIRELGQKTVVILNMVDIAKTNGISIDAVELSKLLGCPVVETVANNNVNMDVLKEIIMNTLETGQKIISTRFRVSVSEAISNIEKSIDISGSTSKNYLAIKIAENDNYYTESLLKNERLLAIIQQENEKIAKLDGTDLQTEIIEDRWNFISSICTLTMKKQINNGLSSARTDKIDKIILHRFYGIPIFFSIIFFMFLLVYVVAGPAVGFLEGILDYVTKRIVHHMIQHNVPALLQSFVTNSILGGVGAVVVFFPNMFVLFFLLSALEDSGYLARGTFIIDRLMYMLGLGGKSFIPIVMGFGCSVPAMVGTRILSNRRDRLLTMLVIPFISCSAKLPVFILFANTLFGDRAAAVVFSLYVLGLLMMIVVTKVLSMTVFKNSESILMMELPVYHLPIFRNVLRITWRDASEFVKKASTFIMLTVFFVWLLSSFPLGVEYASRESYLGMIGSTISPMFAWAGYGFWQAGIALMTGFLAKEAIIGTLGALFGGAEDTLSVVLGKLFTPLSAYSYLIMILFYTPCLTAVATFYRESRSSRWTLFFVSYTFLFGWIMSILVYQVGKMF